MKKLITLSCAIFMAASSFAQESRMKLEDIVKKHNAEMAQKQKKTITSIYESKEKEDYHFQRWLWYAKQHIDQKGYIVPKIEAYRTWRKYEAESNRAASKTTTDQSDWKAIGPFVQDQVFLGFYQFGIGRINTMGFHPTDTNTYAVGTAGGGAWVTHNNGLNWSLLTKNLMSSAISDIDYNPLNPNTIYICTGDKENHPLFGGDKDYNSIGVIKSYDGGKTWDTTGHTYKADEKEQTNALLINPLDTNSLTLATRNSILKSFDGGNTWASVNMPASPPELFRIYFPELVYKPNDSAVVYTAPTFIIIDSSFNIVATGVEFLKSIDGGMTWSSQKYFLNSAVRASIAVSKANPDIVKLIVAKQDGNEGIGLEGIYHSSDAGASFTKIFDDDNCKKNLLYYATSGIGCGGQGHYDLCIAINPLDSNHVIVGGVNSWESNDGGKTWKLFTQWANETVGAPLVHADHHFIGYHPLKDSLLFDCNDGGIAALNHPENQGSWFGLSSGMNITQYYRIAASNNADFVLGGAQDNGTSLLNMRTGLGSIAGGGDGMECQIDPVDQNIIYTSSQGGNIVRINKKNGISYSSIIDISKNIQSTTDTVGTWTAPFLLDPNNHNKIITARKAIYSSANQGSTWKNISTEFSNIIGRLAMTNSSSGTIYATEDAASNVIHYTHDTGSSWTTIQHPYNELIISDIKADNFDKERFWVTFSGFGNNKTKVASYYKGAWATMNENLPDLPVYCIIQDTSDKTLYIGTYAGVYYRTTTMKQWEKFATNLPIVNIMDLEINYTTGELIAGTWGRGMWATPKYKEPVSIIELAKAKSTLAIYPNPSMGSFVVETTEAKFNNQNVTVQIVDVAGKTAFVGNGGFAGSKLSVNAPNLPTGNYIIKLSNKDGATTKTQLVIKQQ